MSVAQPGDAFDTGAFSNLSPEQASPIILDASGGGDVVVPGGHFILVADYARSGPDLVLTGPDSPGVVVRDFFATDAPPSLYTEGGSLVPGDLATRLAGPLAPGQYVQAGSLAPGEAIGTVDEISGDVVAVRADGSRVPLGDGDSVFQGDVLETGDDGLVQIVLADRSEFALEENGRMVLDELVFDGSGGGSLSVSIVQGVFAFVSGDIAKTGEDAMTIRTPVATLGIRGTEGAGKVDSQGEDNFFTVLKGIIAVINSAGITLLDQVNATTAVANFFSSPEVAEVLTPAALENLFGAKIFTAIQAAQGRAQEREQQQLQEQENEGQSDDDGADAGDDEDAGDPEDGADEGALDEAGQGEGEEGDGDAEDEDADAEDDEDAEPDADGDADGEDASDADPDEDAPDDADADGPDASDDGADSGDGDAEQLSEIAPEAGESTSGPITITLDLGELGLDAPGDLVITIGPGGELEIDFADAGGDDDGSFDDGGGGDDDDDFDFGGDDDNSEQDLPPPVDDTPPPPQVFFDGTDDADDLLGNSSDNFIDGFDGDDTLEGAEGDDTIDGGGGDDTVVWFDGDGDDSINGGAGTDTLSFEAGTGADTLSITDDGTGIVDLSHVGSTVADLTIDNVEAIEIDTLGGNDTLTIGDLAATDISNNSITFIGGAGNDLLDASAATKRVVGFGDGGDDTLIGGSADDLLEGGADDDTVIGGAGDDTVEGDAGDDIVKGDAGDDVMEGGAGADTLEGGTGDDIMVGGTEADTLSGDAGADTLSGGSGDDTLLGGAGADSLLGAGGADTLDGGTGDDIISGGADDDLIEYADAEGDDSVDGGTGTDRMEVTGATGGLVIASTPTLAATPSLPAAPPPSP